MIDVEVRHIDQVPVAQTLGDIDASNARQVQGQPIACLGADTNALVVDLSHTRYLDSAGIDMLFRLSGRLRERRGRMVLVIPPGSGLARLAQIVDLPSAMSIHATVEEALGAGRSASNGS